jgi:hypothetical protein
MGARTLQSKVTGAKLLFVATVLTAFSLACTGRVAAEQHRADQSGKSANDMDCEIANSGSSYITVDSWIYPAVLRLYSLGYVDGVYLNMRPWTHASLRHMLEDTAERIQNAVETPGESEAEGIYDAVIHELEKDHAGSCLTQKPSAHVESTYSFMRGITGTPLHDSFHLGSTIVNDYGRPYANGFNNYSGASAYAMAGRFVAYARGEVQSVPSSAGYSSELTNLLARGNAVNPGGDGTTYYFNSACWHSESPDNPACVLMPNQKQTTIPFGPIDAKIQGSVLEAYVSGQYLNHVFSFGKQDFWQGPGVGGAMSYSNNAENIFSFRINRIEPLNIPLLSRITGPFRYDFMVGPMKGHTFPKDPWVHVEKVSFRPTENLEFGFERTVIWGGKGHVPVTIKSFTRSFLSLTAPELNVKNSPSDPGARFGAFDFSYRLPFLRNWITLYADSEVHDDVSPIDAPRRASWHPGIYLSHVPKIPKLDVRVEAATTDPPITNSLGGGFMYYEFLQRQGYTSNGQLFGDWIGRENKGGWGWLTYHLTGNESLQVSIRNQKAAKDFIPGGTTLNDLNVRVVKRIGRDLEIDGGFQYERWKAPIYLSGQRTVTNTSVQLTWFPGRTVIF